MLWSQIIDESLELTTRRECKKRSAIYGDEYRDPVLDLGVFNMAKRTYCEGYDRHNDTIQKHVLLLSAPSDSYIRNDYLQ